MKRCTAILSALLGLLACMKEQGPAEPDRLVPEGWGRIQLTVGDTLTRAAISSGTQALPYETRVNSLFVGVYGDDGLLDWYSTSMSVGTPATATVRTGTNVSMMAVANHPDMAALTACKSISELRALTVPLTANSTGSGDTFVMAGSLTGQTVSTALSPTRHIPLARLATRIAFTKIEIDLDDRDFSYYQDKDFTVQCAFLSNVCGSISLGGSSPGDTWLSVAGREKDGATPISGASEPSDIEAGSLTYSTDCVFLGREYGPDGEDGGGREPDWYCDYLNSSTVSGSVAASPALLYCYAPPGSATHSTKFVTVVAYTAPSGEEIALYYPVTLNGLSPGYSYSLTLSITRLGSTDPDSTDWVYYDDVSADFGSIGNGGGISIDF